MDGDVPDSTDWLSTPLAGLAPVESALRCEVCKDFYKTPMITSCCHTFCSLCIRRALANDGKCPLCRASDQELKLRSNWSMEETVEAFVKARTTTLKLARYRDETISGPKRKAEINTNDAGDVPEGKRLRTSVRLRKTRTEAPPANVNSFEEVEEVVEVPDDDDYEPPEPEDGLVPCPVCQKRMKEWQVFSHLESCTGPTPPKPKPEPRPFGQLQRQQSKALARLPATNYSMLKDQALRRKLAEVGISNQGSRALLERRHKEWVTIWNANCDATQPKKRGELLQDLDMWERTQGGRAPTTGKAAQNAALIKDKNFDGEAWATKHDSSFKDLVASAKKSRMEAKKKAEEASKEAGVKEVSSSKNTMPPESGVSASNAPATAQQDNSINTSKPIYTNHFPQDLPPQPVSSSDWGAYHQSQPPSYQTPRQQHILAKPQPSHPSNPSFRSQHKSTPSSFE